LIAEREGEIVGTLIAGWDACGHDLDGGVGRYVRNL
jgi:hypothetical protein